MPRGSDRFVRGVVVDVYAIGDGSRMLWYWYGNGVVVGGVEVENISVVGARRRRLVRSRRDFGVVDLILTCVAEGRK